MVGLAGGRRAASDAGGEGRGQPVQEVEFLSLNAAGIWGWTVLACGAVLCAFSMIQRMLAI